MPEIKITIKDSDAEYHTYIGEDLRYQRVPTFNVVEVFRLYKERGTWKRVDIGFATNPIIVKTTISDMDPKDLKQRGLDPFTAEQMNTEVESPEEEKLMHAYKALESKRKRRTKAEIELEKSEKQEAQPIET